MLTDVIQLLQDGRAVLVYRVGDLAKVRHDFVVAMSKVTARQYRGRMNWHGFGMR